MKFYLKMLPLFLFIIANNIHALEIKITSKSIEGFVNIETNKNVDLSGGTSAIGELGINNIFNIRSGIYYGRLAGSSELNTFVNLNLSPFTKVSFTFSLFWIYNGAFAYLFHSHSVFPVITYNWKRLGVSLGYNFRFSSLPGNSRIIEAVPVYSFSFYFVNNDKIHAGFIFSNYNEFLTRPISGYSYYFYMNVRLNDNFQFLNGIDILQSGAVAITETFYGISYKLGLRYSW